MFLLHPGVMRRTTLRPLTLVTAATATVGLTVLPASATTVPATTLVHVDVLGITDYHGRLEANGTVAGAAVLAGAVNAQRAMNEDSVFVSSGDDVGASTFVSASQRDQPTIDALNAMDLEVAAVGNHELDGGQDDFSDRIAVESEYAHVSANITGLDNTEPFHVHETPSGVSVGFIGVTTESLPSLVSPAGMVGVEVTDALAAATQQAQVLSDGDEANGEADIVVVLAHEGPAGTSVEALRTDAAYGELVRGLEQNEDVDAVMGGHTHIAYTHELGETFLATQAGQYSEYLSKLSFTYNPATDEVTASSAENIALAPGGTAAFPPDPAVQRIVDQAVEQAAVVGAEQVGEITGDITRGVTAAGTEHRGAESTLSNYIADVHLAATEELDTDLALMNPGGVRDDLIYAANPEQDGDADGIVTYAEAAAVQPFANSLMTFQLTGAQLKAALEQQWQPQGASRPFLRLGVSENFASTYDPQAPAGQRITSMTLNGAPVADNQEIKVVANSFLAAGGDNFTALGEGTGHADAGRIDLDAFVAAMRATQDDPLAPADLAPQRQVGVTVPELTAGGSATIGVSSMLFPADPELGGTQVSIALDGATLGTAPLDRTITDGVDETGRASVTVTIPAGTAGSRTLTVSDGVTTAEVPVTVGGGAPVEPNTWTWNFAGSGDTPAWRLNFAPAEADDVFVGDWDGDGVDTPGYRVGNSITVADGLDGAQTRTFDYGRAGDSLLVGDWDGDGTDTVAVRRGILTYVRDELAGGAADRVFDYGREGDEVLVGDWDGASGDTLAVRRGNVFYVRNVLAGGAADHVFTYGRAGDQALVADWDGDDDADDEDTVSVLRGDRLYVRNELAGGAADREVEVDVPGEVILVGSFDENAGVDIVGVTRP